MWAEKGFPAKEDETKSNSHVILRGLRQFQVVGSMQTLVNDIFGPAIALNSFLMIFLCCVLLYIHITSSMVVFKLSWFGALDYCGNLMLAGCAFLRLIFVFLSLGNVHNASVQFNNAIAKSLLNIKSPKNSELSLIVGSVTMNSVNPISYSAGGYFIFTRGTLMATGSIIATYLLFLLQAQG